MFADQSDRRWFNTLPYIAIYSSMSNVVESTFPSFFLSLSFPICYSIAPHSHHNNLKISFNFYWVFSVKPMKCLHGGECISHLVTLRSFEVTLYFVLTITEPRQPTHISNVLRFATISLYWIILSRCQSLHISCLLSHCS